MPDNFNLNKFLSVIKKQALISNVIEVSADEISERGFYKVRCQLIPSFYKLELKIIKTKKEFFYSYQLFTDKPLLRWDNAPHYPGMGNFPHHFHNKDNQISPSELNGNTEKDIVKVLSGIEDFIKQEAPR